MENMSHSKVIYGNSPFIEDMGLLTTLCLLHDEVLLFGTGSLGDQFDKYWSQIGENSDSESAKVVEQTFQILEPEGVVTFLSPTDDGYKKSNREFNISKVKNAVVVRLFVENVVRQFS